MIRLSAATFDIEPTAMIVTASLSVLFNIITHFFLHDKTLFQAKKKTFFPNNINQNQTNEPGQDGTIKCEKSNAYSRASVFYLVANILQVSGVLIAALVIFFKVFMNKNYYFIV